MPVAGCDIASYQHGNTIDWQQVAANVQFVIIKASQSGGKTTYVNPWFVRDWAAAGTMGLVRGAYHFADPSHNTPEVEASLFLSRLMAVGGLGVGDFYGLDIEDDTDPTADYQPWCRRFFDIVDSALGFLGMLYSRTEYMQRHNLTGPTFASHGLWLASFSATPPTVPDGWPFYAIWQYSETGTVPGITGAVDLDVFNGTLDQLRAYGYPGHPKPVPTNNDFIQVERYLLESPPNIAAAVAYLEPFV